MHMIMVDYMEQNEQIVKYASYIESLDCQIILILL